MKSKKIRRLLVFISVIVISIIVVFPIYWIITSSFKNRLAIISAPVLIPSLDTLVLKNYWIVLIERGMWRNLLNSFIISAGNTVLVVTLGFLAAYAFSRYKFKGANNLFVFTIFNRLAPPAAFLIPFYTIYYFLNLIDTHLGLILLYSLFNLPFAIWLLKGFLDGIPKDIDESALIDGCSHFNVLRRIIAPLAKPGILITSIMVFLFSWNEFLFATSLTRSRAVTIQSPMLDYAIEISFSRPEELYALGTLAILPAIVLLYVFQKHIVSGLTLGAVKE